MKRSGLIVVVMCIAVSTGSAEAELIEFEFGGSVTYVGWNDIGLDVEPPWNQVQVEDVWSMSYVFESTTPDGILGDATVGSYLYTVQSYDLSVGSATVSDSSDSVVGHIDVFNIFFAQIDFYEVSIDILNGEAEWSLQLNDPTGSAWNTDKLPLCGDIDLDNFTNKDFRITLPITTSYNDMRGTVDYHTCRVVPEPATLSLLAIGAILAGRKRK